MPSYHTLLPCTVTLSKKLKKKLDSLPSLVHLGPMNIPNQTIFSNAYFFFWYYFTWTCGLDGDL